MKTAKELFLEQNFHIYNSTKHVLIYKYETDYIELNVSFDLDLKQYRVTFSCFVDNNSPHYVPMEQRPQNIKHSATYGYWQSETIVDISCELHNAIHQQMIELRWLK